MITKWNIRHAKKYCRDDISKIQGYEVALNSPERFLVHHVLELTLDGQFAHTPEELDRMGMYWKRPYYELQWMSVHDHRILHTGVVDITETKNPRWKEDCGISGLYKRARKKFKEGLITEEEFNFYRKLMNERIKERRGKLCAQ